LVGGLVLDILVHVPGPGERLTIKNYSGKVEAIRENRIDLVRISRHLAHPTRLEEPWCIVTDQQLEPIAF